MHLPLSVLRAESASYESVVFLLLLRLAAATTLDYPIPIVASAVAEALRQDELVDGLRASSLRAAAGRVEALLAGEVTEIVVRGRVQFEGRTVAVDGVVSIRSAGRGRAAVAVTSSKAGAAEAALAAALELALTRARPAMAAGPSAADVVRAAIAADCDAALSGGNASAAYEFGDVVQEVLRGGPARCARAAAGALYMAGREVEEPLLTRFGTSPVEERAFWRQLVGEYVAADDPRFQRSVVSQMSTSVACEDEARGLLRGGSPDSVRLLWDEVVGGRLPPECARPVVLGLVDSPEFSDTATAWLLAGAHAPYSPQTIESWREAARPNSYDIDVFFLKREFEQREAAASAAQSSLERREGLERAIRLMAGRRHGAWSLVADKSLIDDSLGAVAALPAAGTYTAWPGREYQAELSVRCREGSLDVLIFFGTLPHRPTGPQDRVEVVTRLDSLEAVELRLVSDTSGQAAFFPSPREMADALSKHQTLVVRYTPLSSVPVDLLFKLPGGSPLIERTVELCEER